MYEKKKKFDLRGTFCIPHACLDARFCLNIWVGLDDISNIYDVFAMIFFGKINLSNIINIKAIF